MNYYLVRTAYGTDLIWAGSSGYLACRNAEAATGLPFVSYSQIGSELPHTVAA